MSTFFDILDMISEVNIFLVAIIGLTRINSTLRKNSVSVETSVTTGNYEKKN